ncbi:hypothetical protein HZF05_00325 [Sphingomonas sp. CGMCC 1.13654]|uniref:Uncharacterized protein n=1 Tax=Sphingomonas chungangi TaxID=2683589 RepID=A0A838L2S2_9SPHN|nr:hypothetical protein [Sphingomonas chungangi]MBA2932526.1 hypothetical protein [Sphingomonas chungangi]MVW56149.1 hypothetical protein [Sphingomonas chungangi]
MDEGGVFLAKTTGRTEYVMGLDEAGLAPANAITVGGVMRVKLSSVRQLSGKPRAEPPHAVYITMASGRPAWAGTILVRTRMHGLSDSFNDPHLASAEWTEIHHSCLDQDAVEDWNASALFGEPDKKGIRCLSARKVSR